MGNGNRPTPEFCVKRCAGTDQRQDAYLRESAELLDWK